MLSKKFLHPEGGSIVRRQLPWNPKEVEEQDASDYTCTKIFDYTHLRDPLQSFSSIRFDRVTSYLSNGW